MNGIVNAFYYVVPFIVLLGVLVFVHEFGHFIIARLCGVKVTDFAIGFGKQLCGFTDKHGTNWKYVRFLWEDIANFWVILTELQQEKMMKLFLH